MTLVVAKAGAQVRQEASGNASRVDPKAPEERHGSAPAVKQVEVRGEWFYVDGEPFLVKGVGYSPYRPGQVPWKDRVDLAVMERDFQRIADAGFNTIRTWSVLPADAVALADRYGLMVLQGIWVDPHGNYATSAFQDALLETVGNAAERARAQANLLAFLIGNELSPEGVAQLGVPETETLLQRAVVALKQHGPRASASYANWPALAFLNPSSFDAVSFNLYPYEPASVAHSFGFRSYIEHLKQTVARSKPLLITEVGLSVSPQAGRRPGYGGLTPADHATQLVKLWEDVFQAGAQGGVVFEWNDEWWKPAGPTSDASTHDPSSPEEWFGLIEFPSKGQVEGVPRPAYEALKTFNQAMLLNPATGVSYQDRIPVTVYATEAVTEIRVRVNGGRWHALTKLNRHWWKAVVPLGPKETPGEHVLDMEAYADRHRLLVRRQRRVDVGPSAPPVQVSLTTDQQAYDVDQGMEPVRYAITVTQANGSPAPGAAVFVAISELQTEMELTQTKRTDANGRIEGTYLVHDPGFVTFSAATPRVANAAETFPRRAGAEATVLVRHVPMVTHRPSVWEEGIPQVLRPALRHQPPAFPLANPGTERIVRYERYGVFHDEGTPAYRYEITDAEGLAKAVGEGVYPNETGLLNDPAYQAAARAGALQGSHWDFVAIDDLQRSFFRWASADEEPGVKQFYTAFALERAGLWLQAVKAYDAILVHFPTSIGWTAFDPPTPWYVGKVARDKIEAILRLHPELGMRLEGSRILVERGFDNDVTNDRMQPSPGKLVAVAAEAAHAPSIDVAALPKKRQLGAGRVRLVQYANRHWQLLVDGRPWIIRGLTYKPTAVGETPDEGSIKDWVVADRNGNQQLDVFEAFVDANRNDRQDPDERPVGDFALMRAMGVNTLRLYHTDHDVAKMKEVLRQLHQQYGFMVMMGDFVGKYTIGSGASWTQGTDYLNPAQRKRMFKNVKLMVREFKDEPYLLMWVLGNENNYDGVPGIVGGIGNAGRYPKQYYAFINEIAKWIHAEDPAHPVALANGETLFLDVLAKEAPAVDIFGANVYRGWQGVGRGFFEEVQRLTDKPVLITEYGCPAYQVGQSREAAERDQALYHFGSWVDVADNVAGRGVGNAIGGVVFEWVDEWWKGGQPPRFSPRVHETQPNWAGPFPGGWNFEEWYGVMSQGEGGASPYVRQPRVSYDLYQRLWNGAEAASE